MPSTMRTAEIDAFGGREVMTVAHIPVPEPGPGQLRIKVEAAGLNYSDIMIRQGTYVDPTPLPYQMGRECCGTIDKLGSGVTGLEIGQRVVATSSGGAFADYMVTAAPGILPCPEGMSAEQGAAVMIQGVTAMHCLTDLTNVQPGENVLIHAAAGGVGTLAVQIANALGANVFGTSSNEEKCEWIRELGGIAINYYDRDWVAELKKLNGGHGVNVILESVGGDIFLRSFKEALEPFGRMVTYGAAGGEEATLTNRDILESNKFLAGYYLGAYFPAHMDRIASASAALMKMIGEGKVRPIVGKTFALEYVAEAFDHMQHRHSIGKVIIIP